MVSIHIIVSENNVSSGTAGLGNFISLSFEWISGKPYILPFAMKDLVAFLCGVVQATLSSFRCSTLVPSDDTFRFVVGCPCGWVTHSLLVWHTVIGGP